MQIPKFWYNVNNNIASGEVGDGGATRKSGKLGSGYFSRKLSKKCFCSLYLLYFQISHMTSEKDPVTNGMK